MGIAHDLNENERTKDIEIPQNITFDTMLLSPNTLEGLKKSGFFKPSPIQLHGIPLGKCGFDLLLDAKSGTGKTAVFSIIMLEKINMNKGLQVIVLAPTREIAAQICDVIRNIGCMYDGLRVEVVMGGLPLQEDIQKFKGNKVHIVVGSPGRLKHLVNDQHIDVTAVRLLVLDEADKLMENSFITDIRFIHFALPQQKQVIMSSATYPETSKMFINEFVRDAQYICPNSNCVLLGVIQKITYVKYNSNTVLQTGYRFKELIKILTNKQFKQCLIFCNYQARVVEVHKMLTKAKWPAEQLYGAQEQIDRLDVLKTLQDYKCRILISTDLASRGIDASNVDLVINFEPPHDWQTYLHRIGRAGRYGSYGMAVTILSEGLEKQKFRMLLDTVNLSANLTPMWNESEDISGRPSEAIDCLQLQNVSEDNNYSKLWNIICQNDVTSIEEPIESFYDLCNSFEKVTTIESFSDLLTSYENNCSSDSKDIKDLQYKCIKWPNISTKQYLGKIKEQLEFDSKHINDTVRERRNQRESQNSQCLEVTCGRVNNELEFDAKPASSTQYNSVECQDNYYRNSKNRFKNLQVNINEGSQINKAKLKSNHNEKHNSSSKPAKQNSYSENKDIKGKSFNKARLINVNQANIPINTDINRSLKCNRHRITTQNHSTDSSEELSMSTINSNHQTRNNMLENSYVNWYTQLKSRVRQIELASYIDELAKLY